MDKPHANNNFFEELLVVLVIYKMEIKDSPAFQSLTKALQSANKIISIFIYDNSQNAHQHTQSKNWSIIYQNNPNNPGVSKAYNQGYELAKSQYKKWLLLVDQDTTFPLNAFEQYQLAVEKFNCSIVIPLLKDEKGIASPLKFYLGGGQRQASLTSDQLLTLKDYFFHNSGLLISAEAFEEAGKYDENLPLDFSDLSFVHRLRKKNRHLVLGNIVCKHQLATTSIVDSHQRQVRFKSYLDAGRYFKKHYRPADWMLSFRLFLRAVKLTFQYRTFQFLLLYFR